MTSSKLYGPENSGLTRPTANLGPRRTAAENSVSPFAKKSSRPSRDHTGAVPPSTEIWVRLPGPGYGRTYTSARPDSSDTYATQLPPGENDAEDSLGAFSRNGFDVRSSLE